MKHMFLGAKQRRPQCDEIGHLIRAEHNIPSSDGIDIDSSKHVRVNDVYIDVNDDCISIKSRKDADGLFWSA